MKLKLRKIIVSGKTFLWKREHVHIPNYQWSKCVEKITIYLEDFKKSPLRFVIKEDDNRMNASEWRKWTLETGSDGSIFSATTTPSKPVKYLEINFNRPVIIKDLIEYFLQHDWNPQHGLKPFEINGTQYLDTIKWSEYE